MCLPYAVKDFASSAVSIESARKAARPTSNSLRLAVKHVGSERKTKASPVSPVRSCHIPFKSDRSWIAFDGNPLVWSRITGIPASISFPAASIPMVLRSIPFTSAGSQERRAGSAFTDASSSMHAEHIEMNASISPFDASISSMTSEAMSWSRASKGNRAMTKGIASTSIETAVELKEIIAWAKEIDAGLKDIDAGAKEIDAWVKEIDADLQERQAAPQAHRFDVTSSPRASHRRWHADISIASGACPRAPSTERVTPDRVERKAPCFCEEA